MGKARQVIIGNSAGGLNAIKAIREVDPSCPIILISAEKCNAYSPVLLTYYIRGIVSRDNLFLVSNDFYRIHGVKTLLGSRAVGVDHIRQMVYLENGIKVEYDNLLIATGASPITFDGLRGTATNVFSLRTVDDADRILDSVKTASEVTIVGAGLIGLQICEAMFGQGVKLTVMESSGQVLPESIDADCAAIIQREIESRGISVLLGKRVRGIEKIGKKVSVVSDSGAMPTADMVVVCVGLRPNVSFILDSGIRVGRGVLVDEHMRTNIKNIFAVGDVSEGKNVVTGKPDVLPTWSNACRQGRIAGLNMAGREQKYDGGLRETTTTIFGLSVAAVGLSKPPADAGVDELQFSEPSRIGYRKILLADGKVVGAILLGKTGDVGILGNLIRSKRNVLSWKEEIARIPLDMRRLLPQSIALA